MFLFGFISFSLHLKLFVYLYLFIWRHYNFFENLTIEESMKYLDPISAFVQFFFCETTDFTFL